MFGVSKTTSGDAQGLGDHAELGSIPGLAWTSQGPKRLLDCPGCTFSLELTGSGALSQGLAFQQ